MERCFSRDETGLSERSRNQRDRNHGRRRIRDNPACIFAIEEQYDGPDGFRAFVEQAHKRGIAVIMDVVYNHLGSPAADMWRFDGWSQGPYGGIYFYNDWRSTTPWGNTLFDYGRPEVRNYILDNARRWLQQRFADGLGWDATGWIRNVYGNNHDPGSDLPDEPKVSLETLPTGGVLV